MSKKKQENKVCAPPQTKEGRGVFLCAHILSVQGEKRPNTIHSCHRQRGPRPGVSISSSASFVPGETPSMSSSSSLPAGATKVVGGAGVAPDADVTPGGPKAGTLGPPRSAHCMSRHQKLDSRQRAPPPSGLGRPTFNHNSTKRGTFLPCRLLVEAKQKPCNKMANQNRPTCQPQKFIHV